MTFTQDRRLIPPSINDLRSKTWLELIARLSDDFLEFEQALKIYNFDTVGVSALPHLAEQLDVTGFRGWILADTEEKQRNLLKQAIELHRHAGTPWAIRTALETLGYLNVQITENPEVSVDPIYYDGTYYYDGTRAYSGEAGTQILYGGFIVNLQTAGSLSPEKEALVIACINAWKNVRSHLIQLLTSALLVYDGTAYYDGEYNYSGIRSELALQSGGGYPLYNDGQGNSNSYQGEIHALQFQVSSNGTRFQYVVVVFSITTGGTYAGHTVSQGDLTVSNPRSLVWSVGLVTGVADITIFVNADVIGSVVVTGVADSEAVGESNTDSNTAENSFNVIPL